MLINFLTSFRKKFLLKRDGLAEIIKNISEKMLSNIARLLFRQDKCQTKSPQITGIYLIFKSKRENSRARMRIFSQRRFFGFLSLL